MSVHDEPKLTSAMQIPRQRAAETAPVHGAVMTPIAAQAMAFLRIVTGLVFLWAFFDKTFGWGYSTTSQNAWINGGSPTRNYLSTVNVGPLASTLRSWAGQPWADWLFMIGLLAIGLAVLFGVGLRISAIAGTAMLALMWIAEWPLAKVNEAGQATHSTNPIIDYHFVYAVVLIVLAAAYAGNTWGLGRRWAELVRDNRWLL
ncbi:DoxX family membrane protein [Amycolatopsis sp. K13G38]|uniref:DoxX family membrane protein n=1 Tax=Amycolatopsis acididurans TaxID=2724524 RepID=A0ABX1IWC9_9PSEU|nr:DoxX family membrane protein [Amycolatopsis acididurans]NKQ51784.1 DoxX family membrane protein [Amycolatopsis acididurans]